MVARTRSVAVAWHSLSGCAERGLMLLWATAWKGCATPCVLAVLLVAAAADGAEGPQALARKILSATGVRGGLIVHVGCGGPSTTSTSSGQADSGQAGKLTAALRANDGFVVQGLDTDEAKVVRAREHIRRAGVYGSVSAARWDGRVLPYVDNLVNLVVAEGPPAVSMDEVMRVLCPNGVAYVRSGDTWTKTVKPRPKELDEWTHWLHGADGNAVAADTAVGPPRHAQWIAEPRWQRHHELTPSLSALVSSGGRLFAIVNEAAPGIDGLPDKWVLVARDAFNGKLLWKRRIAEWGWRQWSDHSHGHGRWNHPTHIARRLVAVGNRVYVTLGFNAPLTALDAATGRTVMTYPQSGFTDEILYHEGTLVLATNDAAQGPGRIKTKPPVKKSVVAMNAETGEMLWKTGDFEGAASKADAIERVTHLTMALGGGKVFCVEENAIVALSLKTGKRLWRKARPERPRPVTYGQYYFTNLCTMVYHDGIVLFMEPDPKLKKMAWNAPSPAVLLGISADTGDVLWRRPCGVWGHYNPGDVFVIDDLAWVHDGQEFSMMALDPRTGAVKRRVSTGRALDQGHHHRCYRNKATSRYIVTGRRGVEFIDIASGGNLRHHWVRGTCRYGTLPCNGLLYAPPHPCICYITAKLTGFWALAPERSPAANAKPPTSESEGLVKGPAYEQVINPQSPIRRSALSSRSKDNPQSADWPTYRHDAARSGCAGTDVAGNLRIAWEVPVGGRLTAPVIAEGRVLVASPETHTVRAFSEADGKPLWTCTAGGRVDTPPTVHGGLALFGSADGWVYCLRADDGKLVWRRRAAREDLQMMNREQLESPWPVHGSVLVRGGARHGEASRSRADDGVAYFAAGRSSFLDGGIDVCAVEIRTGKLIRRKRIYSPDPKTGDMADCMLRYDMPPDALGALPDILSADGTNIYMRHLKFDPVSLDYRSAAPAGPPARKGARSFPFVGNHLMAVAGMLDDSWFNQTYWTVDGKSHCKLLVFDEKGAYGVKAYPGSARHSRAIFKPGAAGYTLFASNRPKHTARWTGKVPVRIVAMVVAGPTLFAAGAPDVVAPDDPWAALEGRKGGVLWAVSTADGTKLAEYTLDHPPIFDGMAAANGRLYIATRAGGLICMAAKK